MEALVEEEGIVGFAEREGFGYTGFHPVEEVTVEIEASNAGFLYAYNRATYANAHDAVSADAAYNDSNWAVGQTYYVGGVPGNDYFISRGGLVFDISSIPAGATIVSAIISIMGVNDTPSADFSITIVSGNDLADTLVVADFGDLLDDVTSFGALAISGASFVLEGWNTITLNATGIAAIQAALASGKIRFGARSSRDIDSITPKLNSGTLYDESVGIYGSNTANKKPILTITYTP